MLRSMSPVATRKRTSRKKKKKAYAWLAWWPLLLAIVATPFAVRSASVLALTGPAALRLLYPYVVLLQSHVHGLSSEQADTLSQWAMYGQFPVYGLVWVLVARLRGAFAGLISVLVLHGAGVAAAFFTAGS